MAWVRPAPVSTESAPRTLALVATTPWVARPTLTDRSKAEARARPPATNRHASCPTAADLKAVAPGGSSYMSRHDHGRRPCRLHAVGISRPRDRRCGDQGHERDDHRTMPVQGPHVSFGECEDHKRARDEKNDGDEHTPTPPPAPERDPCRDK